MANKEDGKYGEFGDYAEAWLSAHDAGSGAYTVESQNPQSETVMVKFPGYFLGFAANAPDKVRYRYGLEASTVRALMSRGEHDIADLWLPPEVIKALAAEKGMQAPDGSGGATGEYIKLNTARAPLDDVHCRLALTYAFDYATALKILKINDEYAQGIPMTGPLPSGLLGYDADAPDYAQDMDKAKAELAQCKYDPKTSPLDIAWIAEVPARERIALLMQASFSKLGFPVKVVKTPWALVHRAGDQARDGAACRRDRGGRRDAGSGLAALQHVLVQGPADLDVGRAPQGRPRSTSCSRPAAARPTRRSAWRSTRS